MAKNTILYVTLHTPYWTEKGNWADNFFTVIYLGTSSIITRVLHLKDFPYKINFKNLIVKKFQFNFKITKRICILTYKNILKKSLTHAKINV